MIFGKHINKYYLKRAPWLLLGILSLVVVDFLQLLVPKFYRIIVNALNMGTYEDKGNVLPFSMDILLDKVCLPLIIVLFSMVICRFLWRICFFGSALKVETGLRKEMFNHCKDLSQQFYDENKVGDLMSLFTNDIDTIQECFGMGILMFFDAALLGIMAVWNMATMNPLLTLLCLVPMIFLFIASTVIGKSMTEKWDKRQDKFSKLSDFSQESFSGIAVVKAFVREANEIMAFRKLNDENEEINVSYTKTATLLRVMVTLFEESVIAVILGYGGYLVYKGIFNAGDLVEFIGYFSSIVWPIMAVSELIDMHSRGTASLKRVGNLLDQEPTVVDKNDVIDVENIKGKIEFKNLSFTYPGATHENLTKVSLTIEAGENVGIIGKTGSGKTTLCDLLLRTYNVPDNTIFVDDIDINKIPIKALRRFAAYVPQDNFLFSDTIATNISFASDNEERSNIENAADFADVANDILGFPNGYDTMLGERGVTVSGGQKQRISIARALMKDAAMLIMDDSVSAVDTKTERKILQVLRQHRKGKTTILIAHRVSTVELMDKIVYMADGTIKAVGTHDELMANCPEYRRTVELQQLEAAKVGDINA